MKYIISFLFVSLNLFAHGGYHTCTDQLYLIDSLQDRIKEKNVLIHKLELENTKLKKLNNAASSGDYYDKILEVEIFNVVCKDKNYVIQLPMKIESMNQFRINGEVCQISRD